MGEGDVPHARFSTMNDSFCETSWQGLDSESKKKNDTTKCRVVLVEISGIEPLTS